MREFYVYILASPTKTLYIGVTNNIERRLYEHKTERNKGFSSKYNVKKLVYYESFYSILRAIAREKQLKKWRRSKKVALIEKENPHFYDLSDGWLL